MSFALDLSKFAGLTEKKMEAVAKKSAIGLFTDIIRDTPVDSGRLKGNWQPAINKFEDDTSVLDIDKTRRGSHSGQSKAKLANGLNRFKLGDMMTLTNNLPYAKKAEFGLWGDGPKTINGFSKKAPAGMVRKNIVRWNTYLDEQARKL